ncbi:MAG: phosphoenolpyruvate--protein phosphotransferase [Planctomycetota bacterium]|nr:MAG: phosphoenolpyruvate--protein phosphotransferase [Planctomycetota bacterium]
MNAARRVRTDIYRNRRKTMFKGIPVVPGIAMGKVHLKFRHVHTLSDYVLEEKDTPRELEILQEAVRLSKEQLMLNRQKMAKEIGELEAMIFDTHIAILEDRAFLGKVQAEIQTQHRPADVVVSVIVEGYYKAMSMVRDENIRERAADIRDVGIRLLNNLHTLKVGDDEDPVEDALLPEGDIVFAREMLPSDIATVERRHVAGVVTEAGSERGHCAVMLRALNIPCVMGVDGLAAILQDGDFVIVDGSSGTVHVNPKKDVLADYKRIFKEYKAYSELLSSEVKLPATTTDNHSVSLQVNISKESEIPLAHLYNMDGVGLYRTELNMMVRNSYPDEEEQYLEYTGVIKAMKGKPITIRTMDLGPDKKLSYIKLMHDDHSALGRRSIRLAMELEEYQMIQLRAILRASVHGNVSLLFPFITSIEDIRMGKRMVRLAKRQLADRGVEIDTAMPIGMMVEVPAAALSLDAFAREVSFFSVGTNDLVQYTCAADRNLPEVAPWYKGYNPGVLQLLKLITETAERHDRKLTLCGEMAGDPFYTMFLVGIGVKNFSMSAPQIPLVKKIVRSIHIGGAKRLVDRALQLSSTGQIRELFQTTVEQILGRDLTAWTKKDGA